MELCHGAMRSTQCRHRAAKTHGSSCNKSFFAVCKVSVLLSRTNKTTWPPPGPRAQGMNIFDVRVAAATCASPSRSTIPGTERVASHAIIQPHLLERLRRIQGTMNDTTCNLQAAHVSCIRLPDEKVQTRSEISLDGLRSVGCIPLHTGDLFELWWISLQKLFGVREKPQSQRGALLPPHLSTSTFCPFRGPRRTS